MSVLPIFDLSGRDVSLDSMGPITRGFRCEPVAVKSDECVLLVGYEFLSLNEDDISIGMTDPIVWQRLLQLLRKFKDCFEDAAME